MKGAAPVSGFSRWVSHSQYRTGQISFTLWHFQSQPLSGLKDSQSHCDITHWFTDMRFAF